MVIRITKNGGVISLDTDLEIGSSNLEKNILKKKLSTILVHNTDFV